MTDTAELRRLLEAATQGEWEVTEAEPNDGTSLVIGGKVSDLRLIADCQIRQDAALIVAMRNALPELLKALEWQPIETAPKEFREILAINDETGTMHVTWFEHGQWHDPDRHYYSEAPDFVPTRWLPIIPPHSLEVARNAGGNDGE